jgi:hypothetical protein
LPPEKSTPSQKEAPIPPNPFEKSSFAFTDFLQEEFDKLRRLTENKWQNLPKYTQSV